MVSFYINYSTKMLKAWVKTNRKGKRSTSEVKCFLFLLYSLWFWINVNIFLRFPEVDKLNGTILRLDEVDFYYSKDKYIFKNVDISACLTSRICIVGENGAGKNVNEIYFFFSIYLKSFKLGKTTLLKILIGELEPVKGVRHTHRALRLG